MATIKKIEMLTVTAKEVVSALQQAGYPISGVEKVELLRPTPDEPFTGLIFTYTNDAELVRRVARET
jgi:hypothetical protein